MKPLHSWTVNYIQARSIQDELRSRVITDAIIPTPRFIAGADVSYSRKNNFQFAAVMVFKYPQLEHVDSATSVSEVKFPYIAGLLTFREGPVLLEALRKLKIMPDVVMFDGQGVAHPKNIGIASHMGLWLDLATIGCAKSRLVGEYEPVGPDFGDKSVLTYSGNKVGYVLRTRQKVKPVFISPGHKINAEQSVNIVQNTLKGFRLPEPVRQAHLTVNQMRKKLES